MSALPDQTTSTTRTARTTASALRNERGASPVSIMILIGVVLIFAELIVMGGRVAAAHADVTGAARQAARQGSIAQTASSVRPLAEATAADNLSANSPHCQSPTVSTAGSNFAQGGQVTVRVQCTVRLSDLSLLSLPWPSRTFQSEATEIVENYRAVD